MADHSGSLAMRAVRRVRDRGRGWAAIARMLPDAGWLVVTLSVLEGVLLGLLPLGFVVSTSIVLDRVSAAAPGSHGIPLGTVLPALAVALGALVLQNALSPAQAALGELVSRRVDGRCADRLVDVSLRAAPLALLERQDVLDTLSDARTGLVGDLATPGAAAAGLLALVSRYTQLLGAVVLVAVTVGLVAGAIIGLTALVARFANRGSLNRWSATFTVLAGQRRRMRYVVDTGSEAAVGKEMRMLGLLPWWRERAAAESAAYLRPLWRQRRRIYFRPFLGYSVVVLAGAAAVLLELRRAAAGPGFSVLDLSIAIQAILIPMRFGIFFPESDVQTQYGMAAHESISGLERTFLSESAAPEAGTRPASGLPRSGITLEAVRFAYPQAGRMVLDGVDLHLPAGTSTAIVGLNGAGKTTLVKLLARLYEPASGRITVDGTDLREFSARSWQRQLAIIFQDYIRYELDAAANIGFGAPDHPRDEGALREAAEWSGAGELLGSLPHGLSTPLSSRYRGGTDLSGGQWQRIALARALFAVGAGATVLVLDEPTAQLDARAEASFFDRFLSLTAGLTTVIISHRFSTVRLADKIVVLAEGRVAEQGTHRELLERRGRYADLFHLQARQFETDEPSLPGQQES